MEKTDLILQELGYSKRSIQENVRERYELNDIEIDIDTWPHLNTFAEFEGNSEEAVLNVLELLNVDKSSITTMDVQSIYLSEGYTKEDLNNLKF